MSALDEMDKPDGIIECDAIAVAQLVTEIRRLRTVIAAQEAELHRLRDRRTLLLQKIEQLRRALSLATKGDTPRSPPTRGQT